MARSSRQHGRTAVRPRWRLAGAVVGALALAGMYAGVAGAASTANASTAEQSVAHSNRPVTNYAGFVGGKLGTKANHKLSTVDIGWVNQQGGSEDVGPESTIGAQLAVSYLNSKAGGIDGHPVKLVSCYIPDTVSAATTCGEEMANNKQVMAVGVGAVAVGNQALESAVGPTKKPLVFDIALGTSDVTYKPGFALYGDATTAEVPFATFADKYLHAKSVSIVYENTPGASIGVDIVANALKYEHVKVTIASYDPTDTDLTAPIEAAGVANAQAFFDDVSGSACSDSYLALKQLDISVPVMVNAPCAAGSVVTADGGTLPSGWYYGASSSFADDLADPSGASFKAVAAEFGQSSYGADDWVAHSFGQILVIAKWESEVLKAGKPLTVANVTAESKLFKGPVPSGAPTVTCGKIKAAPAICNDALQFFQDNSGTFDAVVRWLGPPAGFVVNPNGT